MLLASSDCGVVVVEDSVAKVVDEVTGIAVAIRTLGASVSAKVDRTVVVAIEIIVAGTSCVLLASFS